jgi:hypothetical protein
MGLLLALEGILMCELFIAFYIASVLSTKKKRGGRKLGRFPAMGNQWRRIGKMGSKSIPTKSSLIFDIVSSFGIIL